jgi:hypothetical protein
MTYWIAALFDKGRTLEEIGLMNEYQIFEIAEHERDKNGNLVRPPQRRQADDTGLRNLCLRRGVPRHRLEAEIKAMSGVSNAQQ